MAEKTTVARPYAQAAFDLAQAAGDLKAWSDMLQLVAMVSEQDAMQALIGNPSVKRERLVELIIEICGDNLSEAGRNFIRILGENKRLDVVTEIATLYEQHRAEAEKSVEAQVISAFALSDAQSAQCSEALKKRLGRAIVRAGDLVIDGSVTGQLDKLSHALLR